MLVLQFMKRKLTSLAIDINTVAESFAFIELHFILPLRIIRLNEFNSYPDMTKSVNTEGIH